jgi:hypothetical protein
MSGELYPEHMAWSMADPGRRAELAAAVAPLAGMRTLSVSRPSWA